MTQNIRPRFRDDFNFTFKPQVEDTPVEWRIEDGLTDYQLALEFMQNRAEAIRTSDAKELIWLVEHPPLYTAGTSANINDLIIPDRFPVYEAGRGGEYTYHGPGQRVVYVMLDLKKRREDIRAFVGAIEQWVIDALAQFNIKGERREERVGVWVARKQQPSTVIDQVQEDKIAAIGIRLKKWVSLHGFAINVNPDLAHYSGIIPCGIANHGITSLVDLGLPVTLHDIDNALANTFTNIFGAMEKPITV